MSYSIYLQKRSALLKRAEVQSVDKRNSTLAEVVKLDQQFKRDQRGVK